MHNGKHKQNSQNELFNLQSRLEETIARESNDGKTCQILQTILKEFADIPGNIEAPEFEWSTAFDAVHEPVFIHDKNYLIIRANKAYAEKAQMNIQDVIGKKYWEVFPKQDGPLPQCAKLTEQHNHDSQSQEVKLNNGEVYFSRVYTVQDSQGHFLYAIHTMENLTEQRGLQSALEASTSRYQSLFEDAPDAIFLADAATGMLLDANPAAERLIGRTREDILNLHQSQLHPVNSQAVEDFKSHVQAGMHKVRHSPSEIPVLHADGHEIMTEITAGVFELNGKPVIQGIFRDISARKLVEEQLRETDNKLNLSLNLLKGVLESIPIRVFWKDKDLNYLGCNTLYAKDAGLSCPDELIGKNDFDMSWKDQAALYQEDDQRIMESGIPELRYEEPQTTPDGKIIWLRTSKVPLCDDSQNVIGILGIYDDITERIRIERELHESERRFSEVLGNVELISVMLDREAQVTYCNDYLLHLTDWEYEEVIGKNWWEMFVPPEIQYLSGDFFTSLLDNQPEAMHYENEIITRSGERRLIRWNNSVLRSSTGDVIGTASIGEDITERKKSEASIKYLNRVLSMLSGINTLIVRVNDREELFRAACNIAVSEGEFCMAMIVIVDPSSMLPVSVISAGKDDTLLADIKDVMSTSEGMQTTLVAQAIREKRTLISNDSQSDSSQLIGKQYAKAGIRAMAALPLLIAGKAVGTFVLYANEIEFFQKDEMKLLSELAGDIAFAIDHIDKQEQLSYLDYYDVLTGLANRSLFLDRLTQYIQSANSGKHQLAIGLIDLERFKNINDSLGRPAGDALLKQVAEWLIQFGHDANLLARIDADHFAFVVPIIKSDSNLANLIESMMAAFQGHSFFLKDATFRIGIKVGIAIFPDDGDNVETLYINAEAALKKTKLSGDRYLFYTQKMTEALSRTLTLENQLRRAIDNEEFVLHYQPKVNIVSGKVTSAEALIRWNDPNTGLVPPDKFIPVLEETGLIFEVGRWALHKAIEDNMRWRAAGLATVRIAVNMSPLQLRNSNFIEEVRQVIALDVNAAEGLELEITESLIMDNVEQNIVRLQAIRAMGITIAIDDFGTGFSSLNYLAKLPVDTLKIDRAFVIAMDNPEGLALVSTIIILAHALKLKVVAEGVGTEQQLHQLLSLNCDEMQGFLFSKPVPAEVFEAKFLAASPQSGIHL